MPEVGPEERYRLCGGSLLVEFGEFREGSTAGVCLCLFTVNSSLTASYRDGQGGGEPVDRKQTALGDQVSKRVCVCMCM